MNINQELFIEKAKAIRNKIVAIEAMWDGDDGGWGVELLAVVVEEKGQFGARNLGFIRYEHGEYHDFMQSLTGQQQRQKESETATLIGSAIAAHFRVPFYFPSPNKPEIQDKAARWVDYQAGRISSIPIYLIDPDEVIDYFKDSTVVIIEAFWIYRWRFIPTLSIHVDYQDKNLPDQPKLLRTGSLNLGEFNTRFVLLRKGSNKEYQIGCLDWDDADRGKIIHGKTIPDTAPVDEMVRIGNIIANHFGVSFYFPSPEKPTHNLPRWNDIQDRDK